MIEDPAVPGTSPHEEERYRKVVDTDLERPGAARALGGCLNDPSWRVRKAAAERLAQAPERDDALSILLQALAQRDETGARNAAAEALARMGPWALAPVTALLRHSDPDQRKFAAEILGQMGLPQAEPPLLEALRDADANVRAAAAESLGRVGGHDAIRALQQVLTRGDPLLQLCALDALWALEAPPPLPSLVALLDQATLRPAAYRLIACLSDAPSAEVICRGLRSDHRATRYAALSALGTLWARWQPGRRAELESLMRGHLRAMGDVPAMVREGLADERVPVRRGALAVATVLGDEIPVDEVAHAASEPALAPAAALALGRLGPKAAEAMLTNLPSVSIVARAVISEALLPLATADWVHPLVDVFHSGDPELHLFAVRAMGRTGSAEAIPFLLEALADPGTAAAAARGLVMLASAHHDEVLVALEQEMAEHPKPPGVIAFAEIAGRRARPLVERLRRDPDPALRAAAVEGAARAGDGEETARLALGDETPAVRAAAARAIGQMGGEFAVGVLKLALADRDPDVRVAAIEGAADAGARGVTAELEAAAGDPDGRVAAHAVQALGRLGALRSETLWAAVRHRDQEVIKEALAGAASTPEGEPLALALLEHARWDVRAAAARVLATAGSAAAIPAVRTALAGESDPLVRQALAEAARTLARR